MESIEPAHATKTKTIERPASKRRRPFESWKGGRVPSPTFLDPARVCEPAALEGIDAAERIMGLVAPGTTAYDWSFDDFLFDVADHYGAGTGAAGTASPIESVPAEPEIYYQAQHDAPGPADEPADVNNADDFDKRDAIGPARIRAECAAIRAGWSEKETRDRAGKLPCGPFAIPRCRIGDRVPEPAE